MENCFEEEVKINHTTIYQVDLDSSRQELSVYGIRFVVAFLIFRKLFFCVRFLEYKPAVAGNVIEAPAFELERELAHCKYVFCQTRTVSRVTTDTKSSVNTHMPTCS